MVHNVCVQGELSEKFEEESSADEDGQLEKALTGFLSVVDKEGEFIYVSDNVVKHIGLNQVSLSFSSIKSSKFYLYEFQ